MDYKRMIVSILIIFLCVWVQTSLVMAGVSGHLKIAVISGGPFVDMFTFSMPAACDPMPCMDDRVIVAKFVVDDTANDLSFELRSITHAAKYPVTQFSTAGGGPVVSIVDNDAGLPAAYVYARFTGESTSAGYRMIKIQVRFHNNYNSFPGGEQWKIQAVPSPGNDHYYGFWADGTGEAAVDALVTKPYLIKYITDAQLTNFALFNNFSSPTSISFGKVHINLANEYLPDEMYQFRNVGTKTLSITGVSPSSHPISAYNIESYPAPPLNILPMASFQRRITCKPTVTGTIANVSIDIQTDSVSVGKLRLNLIDSSGILLNSAILIDLSGSMYDIVNGQQKIHWARIAAREFVELFKEILPDAWLSLYSYPNRLGNCPSSEEHIDPNEISVNFQGFQNHLNPSLGHPDLLMPHDPSSETPLAEGISRVYSVLSPGTTLQKKAVILFGDGEHNCDSAGTRRDPDDWYNWTTFRNAGIPFFTIPYGQTNAAWILTFNNLAVNTGGEAYPADITDVTTLQTKFKKSLGKILDLETLKDPRGNVTPGASKIHDVCVTESIYQLVFSVHWAIENRNALEVKVETPDHLFITEASATSPSHARYISGENYAGFVVYGDYLQGGNGSGLWKLHIKGNAGTSYVYQIYAKDRIKTEANTNLRFIGKNALCKVKIEDGIDLLQEANVTAEYIMPGASFNNYLASTQIDPKMVFRAPDVIENRPATLADRKLYALTHYADKPFQPKRQSGKLEFSTANPIKTQKGDKMLKETMDALIYEAPFNRVNYDGLYDIIIRLTGTTKRAECFQREFTISRWADLEITGKLIVDSVIWREVEITPYFDPILVAALRDPAPKNYIRKSIVFTPKDKAGNYFGIGRAAEITFAPEGAKQVGPVVDNLDGSYIMVVQYKKGTNPGVVVSAQGVSSPVIKMEPSGGGTKPVHFGIKGGVNFANLSASGSTPVFDWNNKTGFCLGAFLTFNLSDYFALQPEAFFSRKGLKVDQITTNKTFNIDFIEAPVLLKFVLGRGTVSPSMFAGPFAAFKINDNITPAGGVPGIKTFDFGVTLGAGMDFALGSKLLVFDARYTRGLINIARVPAGTDITVKSKVLSFMIGLRF